MFYAILLGLFSLKAIQPEVAFWDNFVALLLNLIPFILVLLALILGWRKVMITGIGLILISLAYIFFIKSDMANKLVAIGPGILNGLLFMVIYFIKPETPLTSHHEKKAATTSKES